MHCNLSYDFDSLYCAVQCIAMVMYTVDHKKRDTYFFDNSDKY